MDTTSQPMMLTDSKLKQFGLDEWATVLPKNITDDIKEVQQYDVQRDMANRLGIKQCH